MLYEQSAPQDFADQGTYNVKRDDRKALDYFERAARLRHPQAMFNYAALIDDGVVPGRGREDAGELLYRALRSGNQAIFEQLRDLPTMFTQASRMALQRKLLESKLYAGAIDGEFGPGMQRSIRVAY